MILLALAGCGEEPRGAREVPVEPSSTADSPADAPGSRPVEIPTH